MNMHKTYDKNELEAYIEEIPVVTPIYKSDGVMMGCVFKIGSYPTYFRCVVVIRPKARTDKTMLFTSKHDKKLIDGKCQSYEDAKQWVQYAADKGETLFYDEPPASLIV